VSAEAALAAVGCMFVAALVLDAIAYAFRGRR